MKILVVDDEDLLVKGIRFNLQNDGYEVVTGSNGLEAIESARVENPDLIILDVMMPELDGLSACAKIREFSNVPIILLTAKTTDMDKLMGFDQGADGADMIAAAMAADGETQLAHRAEANDKAKRQGEDQRQRKELDRDAKALHQAHNDIPKH